MVALCTVVSEYLTFIIDVRSSKSGDRLTSLDQYILRMKPDQKQIYYLAGSNKKVLEQSPFVEKLLKNGYEVRTHLILWALCIAHI